MLDNIIFLVWTLCMSAVYALIGVTIIAFIALAAWVLWPVKSAGKSNG